MIQVKINNVCTSVKRETAHDIDVTFSSARLKWNSSSIVSRVIKEIVKERKRQFIYLGVILSVFQRGERGER